MFLHIQFVELKLKKKYLMQKISVQNTFREYSNFSLTIL